MSGFPKLPGETNDHRSEEMSGAGLGLTGLDAAPTRKVNTQLVLVVGALVVAGGLLYGMRRFGLGPGVSLAELVVDYPLESKTKAEEAKRFERVLADLDRSAKPFQIADDKVAKNPFSLPASLLPVETADDDPVSAVVTTGRSEADIERERRRAMAKRREEIRAAFARLELQSVIGGRVPVAMISGAMVREGDEVADRFRVLRIGGRAVILEDELQEQHTLPIKQRGVSGDMSVQRDES